MRSRRKRGQQERLNGFPLVNGLRVTLRARTCAPFRWLTPHPLWLSSRPYASELHASQALSSPDRPRRRRWLPRWPLRPPRGSSRSLGPRGCVAHAWRSFRRRSHGGLSRSRWPPRRGALGMGKAGGGGERGGGAPGVRSRRKASHSAPVSRSPAFSFSLLNPFPRPGAHASVATLEMRYYFWKNREPYEVRLFRKSILQWSLIVQKKLPAEFICGGFMKFLSDG